MIGNLTNNIISNLTTNELINTETNIYHVDIQTIVKNAKNDKMFNKLLTLCIKYDIHIFNQCNNLCTILTIDNLLSQSNERQRQLTSELSIKILELTKEKNNEWLIEIENIYIQYRKKFKDIEIIVYILKNILNDDLLQTLCCVQNNSTSSSSNKQQNKKKDVEKYIAVYSN